ncbi:DUF308 domain-containing protein [Xylanibacillus composti]|uniref:DUF4190 domain-containing protein n=1 Tax=Xylanibacillus composti TaxID=1572762 RepID=A0A8J4H1R6_9BACL|nr:DUF308 domain-containing protein [Xylanibacillus composti]MDT9724400.1 DUF308 domain-containing protein [Xylanibacillus composti]GIQ67996.1 hypothetical protein XYCOK13_08200 [Xylanibacillus composti]
MDRKQDGHDQELFEPKTNEFDGSVNAVADTGRHTNEFADELDGEYEAEFSPFREAEVNATEAMNPARGSMTGSARQADEEYAAEVAAPAPRVLTNPEEERPQESRTANREQPEQAQQGAGMGWAALILAIASLFLLPQLLGPAAAIVGAIAWTRGSRALGVWSIVIGLISLVSYFILVPLYA